MKVKYLLLSIFAPNIYSMENPFSAVENIIQEVDQIGMARMSDVENLADNLYDRLKDSTLFTNIALQESLRKNNFTLARKLSNKNDMKYYDIGYKINSLDEIAAFAAPQTFFLINLDNLLYFDGGLINENLVNILEDIHSKGAFSVAYTHEPFEYNSRIKNSLKSLGLKIGHDRLKAIDNFFEDGVFYLGPLEQENGLINRLIEELFNAVDLKYVVTIGKPLTKT